MVVQVEPGLIGQFTPVLALYDPFRVDVPLTLISLTHSSADEVTILLVKHQQATACVALITWVD